MYKNYNEEKIESKAIFDGISIQIIQNILYKNNYLYIEFPDKEIQIKLQSVLTILKLCNKIPEETILFAYRTPFHTHVNTQTSYGSVGKLYRYESEGERLVVDSFEHDSFGEGINVNNVQFKVNKGTNITLKGSTNSSKQIKNEIDQDNERVNTNNNNNNNIGRTVTPLSNVITFSNVVVTTQKNDISLQNADVFNNDSTYEFLHHILMCLYLFLILISIYLLYHVVMLVTQLTNVSFSNNVVILDLFITLLSVVISVKGFIDENTNIKSIYQLKDELVNNSNSSYHSNKLNALDVLTLFTIFFCFFVDVYERFCITDVQMNSYVNGNTWFHYALFCDMIGLVSVFAINAYSKKQQMEVIIKELYEPLIDSNFN